MLFNPKSTSSVSDEQAMQQVMALLDEWKAPEPSPWFDSRMMARFREEQRRPPEGLFARLREQWFFTGQSVMKPLMIAAMALLVMAGGGSYWQLSHLHATQAPVVSATVQDLQVLDNNDQAIQEMDQLFDDDDAPQS
ncbi:MAG: hypothetical protein ACRYF4_09805 [Janthinobacterium lividum]